MNDCESRFWPSGQRRRPLRDNLMFTGELCRAARGLLGWSPQALALAAASWPRDAAVTSALVEAFEAGLEIDQVAQAAICEALYREGYGVVVVREGSAGAGIRWALPAWRRAEGTHSERRWRPQMDAMSARAERLRAWDLHLAQLHGPCWWRNVELALEPPAGWAPSERTDGQSEGGADPGPRAP